MSGGQRPIAQLEVRQSRVAQETDTNFLCTSEQDEDDDNVAVNLGVWEKVDRKRGKEKGRQNLAHY